MAGTTISAANYYYYYYDSHSTYLASTQCRYLPQSIALQPKSGELKYLVTVPGPTRTHIRPKPRVSVASPCTNTIGKKVPLAADITCSPLIILLHRDQS